MAAGLGYRVRRDLPADQQGQQIALRPPHGSIGCQYRQGVRRPRRLGPNRVFRAFAPIGVFDVGSCQRRVYFQDDGRIPAQVRRHAPRLCPRCRAVQGSCRDRFALEGLSGWTCACVVWTGRTCTRTFCSRRTCARAFFTTFARAFRAGRTCARAFCTGRTCVRASSSAAQAWYCLNKPSAAG
jgi:hypothetical protein